jgi:hypothetical protein
MREAATGRLPCVQGTAGALTPGNRRGRPRVLTGDGPCTSERLALDAYANMCSYGTTTLETGR